MNRYQKEVARILRTIEPVDEYVNRLGIVKVPNYRGRRIAWRKLIKKEGLENVRIAIEKL